MKKFHLLLTLVALSLATTSLWAKPAVADANGKMPGKFSVACGKYVYFSQGNLQYTKSTDTWSFMDEQYSTVEIPGQNVGTDYANQDVVSFFGWATSGWDNTAVDASSEHYQPWETSTTIHEQYGTNGYHYGPSSNNLGNGYSWSKYVSSTQPYKNYDWGVYNSGDLGFGWRTLTMNEWSYLLLHRPGNRFTRATVHDVPGLIILPDGWTQEGSAMSATLSNINNASNGDFTATIDDEDWAKLEDEGAVFLPAAGTRGNDGTTIYNNGPYGNYWSSTANTSHQAYRVFFSPSYVSTEGANSRNAGHSVRLVQDVDPADNPARPKAVVTSDPVGKTDMTYTGSSQTLLSSLAGTATGGTVKYKLSTSGSWNTSNPTATNAGDYIVQWFVDATGCYDDSDVEEIHVTIAKALYTPTGSYSVTGNSLTYSGSAQNLVTATNSSNGTLKYSTDGGNTWSTTIPKGTNAGNYTVLYKVVPSNSNYEDYIPDPNTINVSIAKLPYTPTGDYSVTANDLTYDGSDQPLVSLEGSVTDGTVWYKLEPSGDWTTEIPTGNNAGDYSVSYKVVPTNPNYDEYIPTPSNTININIAKANPPATLPESTISIPYDGAEHTLLEVDPVADCVIWYKLGDGDWTTTPPTGTDAGDYSVQYKIVPNDAVNYNTIGPNTVTVTILDYPTVYDVNVDPTAKLSELLNSPSDLKVKRTIYADGEYNTICLPFSLDASALAASPLAGFDRLKTFRGAKVTGTAPDLSIDIFVEDATTIEAGIPYLMTYPVGDNIVDPVFHDVTVTTTTPSATSADGVTFQGMFAQVHIDPYASERDEDYLFLGANSQLVWPASSQTDSSIKMRGFRAYFIIDRNVITPALAPKGTRARIVDAPKTATGIYDASAKFGGSEKILENGILYIIRNGVRYNAQGQIVK